MATQDGLENCKTIKRNSITSTQTCTQQNLQTHLLLTCFLFLMNNKTTTTTIRTTIPIPTPAPIAAFKDNFCSSWESLRGGFFCVGIFSEDRDGATAAAKKIRFSKFNLSLYFL